MANALTQIAVLLGLGAGWRFVNPLGVSAESLQRSLIALVYYLLLPAFVVLAAWKIPLNQSSLRILILVVLATAAAFAAAWFWYQRSGLPNRSQAALILAAAFGGVIFLGMPVTQSLVGAWTSRIAVEYMLVVNLLLLFLGGILLMQKFAAVGKNQNVLKDLVKEPVFWAAVIGLLLNMLNARLPGWLVGMLKLISTGMTPVLLLAVGLGLKWSSNWNKLAVSILPAAAIKLILLPLVVWALIQIIGPIGVKTTKALVLQAAVPGFVYGFIICDKYDFATTTYTVAFSMLTLFAVVTIPVWYFIL